MLISLCLFASIMSSSYPLCVGLSCIPCSTFSFAFSFDPHWAMHGSSPPYFCCHVLTTSLFISCLTLPFCLSRTSLLSLGAFTMHLHYSSSFSVFSILIRPCIDFSSLFVWQRVNHFPGPPPHAQGPPVQECPAIPNSRRQTRSGQRAPPLCLGGRQ